MANELDIEFPGEESAYRKLTARQRRFCEYMELGGLTGVDAVRRIGYKGPRPDSAAYKIRKSPDVRAALAELREAAIQAWKADVRRTQQEVSFLAHLRPSDFYDEKGTLKPPSEWTEAMAAAVASVETEEIWSGSGESRVLVGHLQKVRFWSKPEMVKLKAQMQGQITEKKELAGKDGTPLPGTTVYVIAKDEADKIGQALEDKV